MSAADQDRKMRVSRKGAETDPVPGHMPPPTLLPLIRENIPADLFAYDHGVTWALEWREGRNGKPGGWTKPPKNARTGGNADSGKPATWTPVADVLERCERLGFVVADADPFTFIDVDDGVDPASGRPKPWAQRIVDRFPGTYWEISPSGTGLKGLIAARAARNRIIPIGDGKIEVFSTGKFTTLTGHLLPGAARAIADRQAELDAFLADLDAAIDPTPPRPAAPPPALDATDDAVVERVLQMPRGRQLHADGDPSGYDSGSEADLALCNCYVAGGAATGEQVDRLYRASALYREKWERADYRARTIAKALDGSVRPPPIVAIGPARQRLAATGTDDAAAGGALPDDVPALKAMIVALTREVQAAKRQAAAADRRAEAAERRASMLSRVQSTIACLLRNKQLGQERITAVALTHAFANRESAGDGGDGGLYPIPLKRLAEEAGVSEDAAGNHVKKLAAAGVLRKELRWIPERVNTETGEITPGHRRQYIGPAGGTVVDFVEAVAALAPEKPKNWGGARVACPDHPTAGTVKRWTVHCAACDRLLDQGSETNAPEPKPQDAEIPNGVRVTADPATPPGSVDHYRYRNGRLDHNEVAGGSLATAWLNGQHDPAAGPPPPDQWTG